MVEIKWEEEKWEEINQLFEPIGSYSMSQAKEAYEESKEEEEY